jgi:hypothetical protein
MQRSKVLSLRMSQDRDGGDKASFSVAQLKETMLDPKAWVVLVKTGDCMHTKTPNQKTTHALGSSIVSLSWATEKALCPTGLKTHGSWIPEKGRSCRYACHRTGMVVTRQEMQRSKPATACIPKHQTKRQPTPWGPALSL